MSNVTMNIAKVKFFFVGVGKCGTSWIFELVRKKDLMSVPKIKEPYIIDEPHEKRKKKVQSLYDSYTQMADFSNVYYWDPENAKKIFEYNPDALIIITVRKPSRRIVSHFEFLKRSGQYVGMSMAEYLKKGDSDCLVARSEYPKIIQRYETVFGKDKVLILPLEQLKSEPQTYVDRLTQFCGLPSLRLKEEDKAPVLKRATSRNPLLARTAKSASVLFRKLKLLKILGKLKDSKFIQGILYSESKGSVVRDDDFGALTDRVAEMDEEYETLLRSYGL